MTAQRFITEANKHRVCQMLRWSALDYASYQQEKGLEYLQKEICGDAWSVDNVAKCTMFWKWWINHWNSRDAEFIGLYNEHPLSWLKRKYDDLNDVDGFKFYPHKIIMENTFALMIDGVNNEAVAMEVASR